MKQQLPAIEKSSHWFVVSKNIQVESATCMISSLKLLPVFA